MKDSLKKLFRIVQTIFGLGNMARISDVERGKENPISLFTMIPRYRCLLLLLSVIIDVILNFKC